MKVNRSWGIVSVEIFDLFEKDLGVVGEGAGPGFVPDFVPLFGAIAINDESSWSEDEEISFNKYNFQRAFPVFKNLCLFRGVEASNWEEVWIDLISFGGLFKLNSGQVDIIVGKGCKIAPSIVKKDNFAGAAKGVIIVKRSASIVAPVKESEEFQFVWGQLDVLEEPGS